jgi:hypothetical protein
MELKNSDLLSFVFVNRCDPPDQLFAACAAVKMPEIA